MRLLNGHPCKCEDVPTSDLVPCCPDCRCPLAASKYDKAFGFCVYKYEGGRCFYDRNMVPPDEFIWLRRDLFMTDDLPRAAGWAEVDTAAAIEWLNERSST